MSKNREVKLTSTARTILEKRYLKKDQQGNPIETPEELFYRVAENIAQSDLIYEPQKDIKPVIEEFYDTMANLEFIPNSPTLMNAGRELQQLSACFVLPVEDSMESIFETLKNTALIHKSGGGTGFSFSKLRPKKDIVQSTSGISSGPVSFMEVFNAATEAIKQGGTRRGANMGILRVDHPDILEFISCKNRNDKLINFNISVALTEEFIEAVEDNKEYPLRNPRTEQISGMLDARMVFDKIVEHAHNNGEPGVVFLDRINESNPTPELGKIESTNPCGEQPLLPYESCNLGSINLALMYNHENNDIDWNKLARVTRRSVHFLDNVIDMNHFPIPKIEEMTKANRKIGLGVMGWADLLIQLKISYSIKEALRLAEKVMGFIHSNAVEASVELAKTRGEFPNFKKSVFKNDRPRRNATLTTIAPTGTIGMIAGVSNGVEPLFAIVYKKSNILDNQEFLEINPYFEEIAKQEGFYSEELMREVAKNGSIQKQKSVPAEIRRIFVTAHDIPPEYHIRMQAAFQKYTDNAVSKTVNFPHDAKKEEIARVYMLAYQLGCKGVTVYRDRSRDKQVINIGEKSSIEKQLMPRLRPSVTHGTTIMMNTGCGKMYITINEDEKGACELFAQLGKSGGCAQSQAEATGRLVSLALRSGINVEEIIKQLKGIRCPTPMFSNGGTIFSCADAIGKAVEIYMKERNLPGLFDQNSNPAEHQQRTQDAANSSNNLNFIGACPQCPDCGEMLIVAEGCVYCRGCGYSKCW